MGLPGPDGTCSGAVGRALSSPVPRAVLTPFPRPCGPGGSLWGSGPSEPASVAVPQGDRGRPQVTGGIPDCDCDCDGHCHCHCQRRWCRAGRAQEGAAGWEPSHEEERESGVGLSRQGQRTGQARQARARLGGLASAQRGPVPGQDAAVRGCGWAGERHTSRAQRSRRCTVGGTVG